MGDRQAFYEKRRKALWRRYWSRNDGSDILLPNGFKEYPFEIYNQLMKAIDKDGEALDLGCGNGLLLKHIMRYSGYKIIPHGIDFIEESIRQARETIHPEYQRNFRVANIAEAELGSERYDYIFLDPYSLHPDDVEPVVEKAVKALKPGGKIIFYTYRDVLTVLKIIGIFRLKRIRWVGDLLPKNIAKKLERIDHREVSIGIYRKTDD